MTMLKTFDLKGNKQSFAEWISNLSPCETPFISMINKEATDQIQYSWQTDALAAAKNDPIQEGSAAVAPALTPTSVKTNFTQIFRKAVRVSDTTKKIGLYGRASELAYQMEKAGMEIKRDLESHLLNSREAGRPGTAAAHGIVGGTYGMIAAKDLADTSTGAIVHKVVNYSVNAPKFTQVQVFDLTYNLYLAGSRANKVMVHPMNMSIFSDWVGNNTVTPHVHRMFDGMDTKFNAHVSKFRDPLGQEFEIIPNRYMAKNQLFFFHDADWTQMILRAPEQSELGKTGSAEKHMIEMEVGLRHRNPFASGILEFNANAFRHLNGATVSPAQIKADGTAESTVTVSVMKSDGTAEANAGQVEFTAVTINHDGQAGTPTITTDASVANGKIATKIKHTKGARIKVTATEKTASNYDSAKSVDVLVDTFEPRD